VSKVDSLIALVFLDDVPLKSVVYALLLGDPATLVLAVTFLVLFTWLELELNDEGRLDMGVFFIGSDNDNYNK